MKGIKRPARKELDNDPKKSKILDSEYLNIPQKRTIDRKDLWKLRRTLFPDPCYPEPMEEYPSITDSRIFCDLLTEKLTKFFICK